MAHKHTTSRRAPPLTGIRIAVTRARGQGTALADALKKYGASVIHTPAIRFVAAPRQNAHKTLEAAATCDWMVFTSANAVRYFMRLWKAAKKDHARFSTATRVVSIGPATSAALRETGVRVHLEARISSTQGVVAAMRRIKLQGQRVVIPRSSLAKPDIVGALTRRGAKVAAPVVYATQTDEKGVRALRVALRHGRVHGICFTSGSTVAGVMQALDGRERSQREKRRKSDLLDGVAIFSIGPKTSACCAEYGLAVTCEAHPHTGAGLAKCIADFFSTRQRESGKPGQSARQNTRVK